MNNENEAIRYSTNKDEYIDTIIEDITKRLNNGESEDKVIDYLMSLGMSLEDSRKTLTFIPSRKNMTMKIFKFTFWLILFLFFILLFLFIAIKSDGSYTQQQFIFMGISAFLSWLTLGTMKKSYRKLMGRE